MVQSSVARTPICGEHTLPQLLQHGGFPQAVSAILRPSYHLQMKNWSWGRLNNFFEFTKVMGSEGHPDWLKSWADRCAFDMGMAMPSNLASDPWETSKASSHCEAQRDGSFCSVCRCWWYMHNILVPDADSLKTAPLVETAPMRLVKLWDLSSCIPQTCLHITQIGVLSFICT